MNEEKLALEMELIILVEIIFQQLIFQSTIPALFNNSQNLDAVIFLDAANVWGVDYDSSLDDGSQIRSSIGIG